jgi:prevent-host-death family protein
LSYESTDQPDSVVWSVREARAHFSELLERAREGKPQLIRQSKKQDVQLTVAGKSGDGEFQLMSYVLSGLAAQHGYEIALDQYDTKTVRMGHGSSLVSELHMPANLTGDVVRWIARERGSFAVADYIRTVMIAMRKAQELLELPLSTIDQVVVGINLAAGKPTAIGPAEREQITLIAHHTWGGQAQEVLGPDWTAS